MPWMKIMQHSHRITTINIFRPRQCGRHFPDDIFKCIFLNENGLRHYAGGPRRPPPPQLHLRRSRNLARASLIHLAQTPWSLTGRARLQAGAQQAVIVVDPSFKSLGIASRNVSLMFVPKGAVVPFHKHFSPRGEQSEQNELART